MTVKNNINYLLILLMLVIGTAYGNAQTSNSYALFKCTNSGYGYLCNNDGTLGVSSGASFDPKWVWVVGGGNLNGDDNRTVKSYVDQEKGLVGSAKNNAEVSLGTPSEVWRDRDDYIATRENSSFSNWGGTNYYLKATSTTAFATQKNNNQTRFTPVYGSVTEHTASTVYSGDGLISLTLDRTSLEYGEHTQATVEAGTRNKAVNAAYTLFSFDGANHYWYDDADHNTAPAAVNTDVPVTYSWTITGSGAEYISMSSNAEHTDSVFTYSKPNLTGADVTATITITATYAEGSPNVVSRSADITIKPYAVSMPRPVYVGGLANSGRKINSISLKGTTTAQQTITCGENMSYMDKTREHFTVRENEEVTATFAWSGSWMHGYIYLDLDKNREYSYGIKSNGVPSDGSNLVAYSAYSSSGYKNSLGASVSDNPGINPPAFTAPSTAGVYNMRYKTDWNSLDPQGGAQFQSASGVAIDVMLYVCKVYNLTIVNPHSGAGVSINGAEGSYTASGTVLSVNPALAVADITATDSRGGTPTISVDGTNITVTFEQLQYTAKIINGTEADRVLYAGGEYANDELMTIADSFEPKDMRINVTNRFVWGPIIDETNKTVTFEIRSAVNSITPGYWYQVQMVDKLGTAWSTSRHDNVMMAQEVSTWPMDYPGSQIYMIGANKTSSWTAQLTGVPTDDKAYLTYLYVPSGTALQMQNGGFIGNGAQYSSAAGNVTLSYDSGNNSFTWSNQVAPWQNINGVNASVGYSTNFGNGYIQLLFHQVTFGEDYDIYKVVSTSGAVVYTGAATVYDAIADDTKWFFVPKGTNLQEADFTVDGIPCSSITVGPLTNGHKTILLTKSEGDFTNITSLSEITNPSGKYLLTADIEDASTAAIIETFRGTFDGNFHKIKGLRHAIFGTVSGATIRNVIVDNVSISGSDYAGAIANVADGATRIYNCGVLATGTDFSDVYDKTYTSTSAISATKAAGGIVGQMKGSTRIANCYSYADITSGGTGGGGIVGDYVGTWYNGSGTNTLMVANCMFYGNITGTNRSPIIYGGTTISDTYSKYSYFRYKSFGSVSGMKQNGALAIQEDIWLKRFKFYQSGVTNHRDMAAYYIFGDASRINDIAQWYIDETIAPWPILRRAAKQKSVLGRTIPNTGNANEGNLITNVPADVKGRYNMNLGNGNGYLPVTIKISGTGVASGNISIIRDLPITDMDDKHFDYIWGKVVLPFANEFDDWTPDYDYICTGWEIVSVSGGTPGTLDDYDYADRNCTNKDIYHATNNPVIFAQGGNYIIPYGVTAITINAHFAKAHYLSDARYDANASGGYTHGGTRPSTYHSKPVHHTVADAWTAMDAKTLPHDQAIVLVGNYHYTSNVSYNHTSKGCTIMSIDEDCDQQPDYGWYSNVGNARVSWPAIRWDFITIPSFGMLQMNANVPGLNIPAASGWFEISETVLCRTFEFEISDARMTRDLATAGNTNAYIIKGGWFQQMVRCYTESGTSRHDKLSYVNVGGNAYIKEFFHGNHSARQDSYVLRPINVTGGEIEQCFMTGMGSKNVIVPTDNNVRFFCSGGKIGKYLSVYNGYPVTNATMKVDHARIGRFFGGGTTPIAALKGDIDVTMNYSDVGFFCGGPEFGDMVDGKRVTVSTTGSTFGDFYGAGFGGTALTRITYGDGQKTPFSQISRLNYNKAAGGFGVSYEMEALVNFQGNSLFRYYDYRADLSMASTGNVTVNAERCLFKNNFFGGGCQGKVNGSIVSTLTDCIVNGSAYGGGYKAAATQIDVYPAGGNTWPVWDSTYKAFSAASYPASVPFTWAQGAVGTSNESARLLYTDVDMTQMGVVTGDTSLTIKGSDTVIDGDVFGGGAESKVLGNTNVVIGEQQ